MRLNYHHLRYFQAIAHEGSLTRAAMKLHISQSALSVQLKSLEERLGHTLFERANKRLTLTEAGRVALEHADAIFRTGDELVNTLAGRRTSERLMLRVGAVATLSRNFQAELLRPLLARGDADLVVHSGSLRELLGLLGAHAVDMVLSNQPVPRDAKTGWHSHLIARQPVSLVGRPSRKRKPFRFPEDLRTTPVVLPGHSSNIRAAFDLAMDAAGIQPRILAEIDDMAMLRIIAREAPAVTLVPPVVVRDELKSGALVERCRVPGIEESFHAITASRRFPHPLVRELLGKPGRD